MPTNPTAWKTDNYKFVGKAFDFAYNNRMNKLSGIMGTVKTKSADYELTGTGGYGELPAYDGVNLNVAQHKRGFKTIMTPGEFALTRYIGRKEALNDRSGICARVGSDLGNSASMTVYMACLRTLKQAFDPTKLGGDGQPWASEAHPIASIRSEGRKYIADPDSGTYSNLVHKALSVSAITDAQTMANEFVTPDGLPFLSEFNMLLVSPANEAKAKEICGEYAKYRPMKNPDNDSNAANPVPDLQYMVIGGGNSAGFSGKQWAICDANLMKSLFLLVYNTKPEVIPHELDNPLIDAYTAYVDFACGWGDGRPIIFSDPA